MVNCYWGNGSLNASSSTHICICEKSDIQAERVLDQRSECSFLTDLSSREYLVCSQTSKEKTVDSRPIPMHPSCPPAHNTESMHDHAHAEGSWNYKVTKWVKLLHHLATFLLESFPLPILAGVTEKKHVCSLHYDDDQSTERTPNLSAAN